MSVIISGTDGITYPDGSQIDGGYTAKAWVNFNGEGTVAINSDGNVSSITDNGTGDYTANYTNAMANANYSVSWIARRSANENTEFVLAGGTPLATGSTQVKSKDTAFAAADAAPCLLQIIGDV